MGRKRYTPEQIIGKLRVTGIIGGRFEFSLLLG